MNEQKEIIVHENELLKLQKQQNKPKRKPKWMSLQDKKLFYSFELETPVKLKPQQPQKKMITPLQIASQKLLDIGETIDSLNFAYTDHKFACCLIDNEKKMLWANTKFQDTYKINMNDYYMEPYLLQIIKNTQKFDPDVVEKFFTNSEEKLQLPLEEELALHFKKIFKGEIIFGAFVTFENVTVKKTKKEIANEILAQTGLSHSILEANHGDKFAFFFTLERICLWMSQDFMKFANKTEDDLLQFGILQKLLEKNKRNESLIGVFIYLMKEKPKYYEILAEFELPIGGKSKSRMFFERVDTLDGKPFGYLEKTSFIYHLPVERSKLADDTLIKLDLSYESLRKKYEGFEEPIFLIDTSGKLYWGNDNFFLWIKRDQNQIVCDDLLNLFQINQEYHAVLDIIKYVSLFKPDVYTSTIEMEKLKMFKSNIELKFNGINLNEEIFGYIIQLNNISKDLKRIKKAPEKVNDHKDQAKLPICMINLDFECLWMNTKFKEYFEKNEGDLSQRMLIQIFEKNTNLVEFITLCVKEKRNSFEIKLNTSIDKIIFETIHQNNDICGYYVIFYPTQ